MILGASFNSRATCKRKRTARKRFSFGKLHVHTRPEILEFPKIASTFTTHKKKRQRRKQKHKEDTRTDFATVDLIQRDYHERAQHGEVFYLTLIIT